MPQGTTFDDVWKMMQETSSQMRETDLRFQETDLRFKETDRKIQESDRKIQEIYAQTAAQMRETDRLVKDVSRQVGNLTGKWGQFVENMVAPGCETLFAQRGIPVHQVHQRVRIRRDDGRSMEIDILVVNTHAAVLVEVKSTLSVEDVREHMVRLQQFKEFFPRYGDCRVMGAVAGITVDGDAERFANNQGLFVITQSGEGVILANAPEFQPQSW